MAVAQQHDLTLYDGAYSNWHCGSAEPIATCDAALVRAAERCDVEVLSARMWGR